MDDAPYLSGQFLLAMPGIGDPRFERAILAMCVHDPGGALGLALNRVHVEIGVRQLMEQLDIDPRDTPEAPVYAGGPVEPGRGFVLHSCDYAGQDTVFVGNRWALTGTLDILKAIAEGKGPRRWVCALGYAGWEAGQLEDELGRHGWLATEGSDDLLWHTPPAERWARAYATIGIDVGHLSATAGRA